MRRAVPEDLPTIKASLGLDSFSEARLAWEANAEGALLVAWLDGVPAGWGYLSLAPANTADIREHLPGVPLLKHLEVLPHLRGRGVGTEIIRVAEAEAKGMGHDMVALAVGVENARARQLYERMGFLDWGLGTVTTFWENVLPDGRFGRFSEVVNILVKRL